MKKARDEVICNTSEEMLFFLLKIYLILFMLLDKSTKYVR